LMNSSSYFFCFLVCFFDFLFITFSFHFSFIFCLYLQMMQLLDFSGLIVCQEVIYCAVPIVNQVVSHFLNPTPTNCCLIVLAVTYKEVSGGALILSQTLILNLTLTDCCLVVLAV